MKQIDGGEQTEASRIALGLLEELVSRDESLDAAIRTAFLADLQSDSPGALAKTRLVLEKTDGGDETHKT